MRVTDTTSSSKYCWRVTLVKSSFRCSFVLPGSASFTVRTVTGSVINRTIFKSVCSVLFKCLSMNDVPRRTGAAKFLTIPNMTRMRLSTAPICNTIVKPLWRSAWPHVLVVGYRRLLSTVASQVLKCFFLVVWARRHYQKSRCWGVYATQSSQIYWKTWNLFLWTKGRCLYRQTGRPQTRASWKLSSLQVISCMAKFGFCLLVTWLNSFLFSFSQCKSIVNFDLLGRNLIIFQLSWDNSSSPIQYHVENRFLPIFSVVSCQEISFLIFQTCQCALKSWRKAIIDKIFFALKAWSII